MIRALQIAHLVLLLTGAALCGMASWLLWSANRQAAAAMGSVTANLNATLTAINRPCGVLVPLKPKEGLNGAPGHLPCGTLADVAKTLGTLRGTAGQIEIAARHEQQRMGVLDRQEAQIYRDTHRSLGQLSGTLTEATTTITTARATIAGLQPVIEGLQPVEARLADEMAQLQTATASVNALLRNPDLTATLANTSHASASLAAIADDTRTAVHGYFHPKWPKRVWGVVAGAGLTTAKFFF